LPSGAGPRPTSVLPTIEHLCLVRLPVRVLKMGKACSFGCPVEERRGSKCASTRSVGRRVALALLTLASIYVASVQQLRAQISQAATEHYFDIPSQPLAAALRAYGKASGLEVFYDGSLSVGRRSSAVMGTYTPLIGLRVLLRGTGYVARETDIANTITIVAGPSLAPLHATFDRYQPYFAALQTRLSAHLCSGKSGGDGDETTLRFWIDSSGVISKAELLGSAGESDGWRREVVSKVQGLQVGKSPPAGLPQPLTMVIYPLSADEATSCSASDGRRDGN
jgi:hypothetical protein